MVPVPVRLSSGGSLSCGRLVKSGGVGSSSLTLDSTAGFASAAGGNISVGTLDLLDSNGGGLTVQSLTGTISLGDVRSPANPAMALTLSSSSAALVLGQLGSLAVKLT